jgi:hypothetical protein
MCTYEGQSGHIDSIYTQAGHVVWCMKGVRAAHPISFYHVEVWATETHAQSKSRHKQSHPVHALGRAASSTHTQRLDVKGKSCAAEHGMHTANVVCL